MADQTKQQLMFSLIEIWKQGDQSQQEFCREKDLDYNQFHYWLRRYKKMNDLSRQSNASFARVRVKELPKTISSIELVYPDGRKLIIHQPVDVVFLRSLLG